MTGNNPMHNVNQDVMGGDGVLVGFHEHWTKKLGEGLGHAGGGVFPRKSS